MPQSPDDWQQMAAAHDQAKRAGDLERIKRKARRGNALLGAGIMFFGFVALLLGASVALRPAPNEGDRLELMGWMLGGGAATLLTGLAIWKGSYR